MYYDNYHFWGMHFVWWFIWLLLLIWIFAIPYDIPGQRNRRDTPLDILKKEFATGRINKQEYMEKKKQSSLNNLLSRRKKKSIKKIWESPIG